MMVEKGITEPDDPFLKERIATLKLRLASIGEEVIRLERQTGAKSDRITSEKVAQFAAIPLADGESRPTSGCSSSF